MEIYSITNIAFAVFLKTQDKKGSKNMKYKYQNNSEYYHLEKCYDENVATKYWSL